MARLSKLSFFSALLALVPHLGAAGPADRAEAWSSIQEARQGNRQVRSVASQGGASEDPDPDYDRLDGKGHSGKKVDVVEWEGNLEIHVYPAGSLKGLALKLDKRNENKPVMVIGYRFDVEPDKQLIRRAVLGVELNEPFKVYKDPSAQDYDKIVISNNGLSAPLTAYRLDPAPRQLYPDGHPALAESGPPPLKGYAVDSRKPASSGAAKRNTSPAVIEPEEGTIQPFFTRDKSAKPTAR